MTQWWWGGLDAAKKSLVAALGLVALGAVVGVSPLGALPGRVTALERRVDAGEVRNDQQDSLLQELADGRRFNTCLGLSTIRNYDPEICERVLPNPERFIPLGTARRTTP